MPRSDPKNYGKPRKRFRSDAEPQKPSKRLAERQDDWDKNLKGKQGYHKPGSQK